MIDQLLLAAALVLPADDRTPPPSRGVSNRWHDSGVFEVWDGVPKWVRDVLMCVRAHESHHAYTAHNPTSSAAGAYQYLTATWQGTAKWARMRGQYIARQYATADKAPAWVQDRVAIHTVLNGGLRAWHGTGCPGT